MPFAAPVAPLLRKFGLHKVIDLDVAPDNDPLTRADGAPPDSATAALIDEIRAHNPSASHSFLLTFTRRDLETYLEHLGSAQEPRGRTARWLRPGDTPAMVLRQQHD